MDHAAIELTSLTKRYRRGRGLLTAVDDVTLSVPAGQVIGLLGPNGAGKTTTIKMLCGLILPSAGTIQLNGHDVGRQRAAAVRQLGAVLEGSRNVYWPLSAWRNLLYFGRLKGLRASEIRPRAQRLLTELGLWERRHETVGSYSRGMQQKVAVAAALITDPPILLLDEPTIGLDVEAARTVKDWIAHLARDEGKIPPLVQTLAGFAPFTAGNTMVMLPVGEHKASTAICYEVVYPSLVRDAVLRGSELLTTITNDAWYGYSSAPFQHFAMASMRAIEHGRYLARAANTGISGIVDPYGRVVAQSAIFEQVGMVEEARFLSGRTVYATIGDVVAYAAMAVVLIALVATRRRF